MLYGPCITPMNANKTKDIGKREYIIDIIDEVTINKMKIQYFFPLQDLIFPYLYFFSFFFFLNTFIKIGFPYNTRRGATHPYGITQDAHGAIYASFQDTDSVLRFVYDPLGPNVR